MGWDQRNCKKSFPLYPISNQFMYLCLIQRIIIINCFVYFADSLQDLVSDIGSALGDLFTDLIPDLFDDIGDGLTDIADFVIDGLGTVTCIMLL